MEEKTSKRIYYSRLLPPTDQINVSPAENSCIAYNVLAVESIGPPNVTQMDSFILKSVLAKKYRAGITYSWLLKNPTDCFVIMAKIDTPVPGSSCQITLATSKGWRGDLPVAGEAYTSFSGSLMTMQWIHFQCMSEVMSSCHQQCTDALVVGQKHYNRSQF